MTAQGGARPRKASGRKAPAQPARAAWGTISREQVVDAAVDVVSAGGYPEMTIRSLASRLGVAPMSLYRHVRDKGDLLDEVVDRLLAGCWQPRTSRSDWRAWVEEAADKFRAFLVAQPAALDVYLSHPVVAPAATERMAAMMGVLRSAGFDEAGAKRAYAAVHTYTLGFAALEASRSRWAPPEGQLPALAKQLAAYTTVRQFSEGLNYMLDGLGKPSPGPDQKKPRKKK